MVPLTSVGRIRHLQESVQSKSVKLLLRVSWYHFSHTGCTGRPAALALFIFNPLLEIAKIDLLQKAGR